MTIRVLALVGLTAVPVEGVVTPRGAASLLDLFRARRGACV